MNRLDADSARTHTHDDQSTRTLAISPFSRLATVELQLIMHHCDKWTLLALARCNRTTRAAASNPFAWQWVSPLHLYCHSPIELSARLAQSSLLRRTNVAVEWELQSRKSMSAEEAAALAALPRLRSLVMSALGKGHLSEAGVGLLADALRHSGTALESLHLRCKSIGTAGAGALAAFVQHSLTLTTLVLECESSSADKSTVTNTTDAALAGLFASAGQSGSLRRLHLNWMVIQTLSAGALAGALAQSRSVTELSMFDCQLGPEAAAALVPGVAASSSLQRLSLSSVSLGNAGALALAAAVADSRSLTDLDLATCGFDDAAVEALAAALERCPTMRRLGLSCSSGRVGEAALGRLLSAESCTLTAVNLSGSFQESDAAEIAAALQINRSLTELTLPRWYTKGEGALAAATALQHSGARSGLRTLVLCDSMFDSRAAAALADALRNGLALERINLSSLDDAGAAALAVGLPHCPTLRRLSLSSSKFGAVGAEVLARGITGHCGLVELDLTSCPIGDAGLAALAPALTSCRGLCSLRIGECLLTALSASALLPLLQQGCSLTSLHLDGNELGAEGAVALAAALHGGSALSELGLARNAIGTVGMAALSQAIHRGWNVAVLNLWRNKPLGDEGVLALAAALAERGRTLPLVSLSLARCGLSQSALLALVRAAQPILKLHWLDLSKNLRRKRGGPAAAAAVRAACAQRPDINLMLELE